MNLERISEKCKLFPNGPPPMEEVLRAWRDSQNATPEMLRYLELSPELRKLFETLSEE